ncbi:hypothetical protein PG996_006088 [Apiospora saccharicola]|uniref:Uncharacterized protein n=1 Tax=Apiospora saccharicola TaxID=335842 RepID=A0ABR1VRB0_9PEZI
MCPPAREARHPFLLPRKTTAQQRPTQTPLCTSHLELNNQSLELPPQKALLRPQSRPQPHLPTLCQPQKRVARPVLSRNLLPEAVATLHLTTMSKEKALLKAAM